MAVPARVAVATWPRTAVGGPPTADAAVRCRAGGPPRRAGPWTRARDRLDALLPYPAPITTGATTARTAPTLLTDAHHHLIHNASN